MHNPGISGQGELRGQPANLGSPGKMAVKSSGFKGKKLTNAHIGYCRCTMYSSC